MSAKLTTLLVILQLMCSALAQCPWTVSGAVYWSAASTWAPNPVPALGSNVVIPSGMKVIYDVTTPGITYAGITISNGASLIFDGTKNCWLETHFVNIVYGASFLIGSSTCHYPMQATITLTGAYNDTEQIVEHAGTKNVIIQGLLEWYGTPPQPTWTNVAATVPVNASVITVKDPITNWKVGDWIAIASTDYYQNLTEQFQIAAISGQTITLNGKVQYMHYGAENEYAEVGHITRNILVRGDNQSDAQGFGGHCITMYNGTSHVYGVEFTKMGQRGILARYPYHWHFMGDQIGKGHFIEECAFHHNYQRCVTVHGTSGVFLQNNVGYNVTGHCYFLEEGSETYNTYNHNLGMVVNVGPMIPSDLTPSIFWITNPNNTFTNNVAVGGEFGFWFSLPLNPIGLSSGDTSVFPRFTPLIQFDNNLAHSADDSGIFSDQGPTPAGVTAGQETGYTPLVPPYTTSTQTYNTPAVRATLTGNNAYKCRQHGIWFRGSQITIRNSLLQDNGVGVNMPATGNLFRDSVIVGETGNIGTPGNTQYFNDFGRSRPVLWWADFPIHGFEGYDSTGGQFCRNVSFQNFVSNSVRRAGAIGAITDGIFVLPPNDMFAQISLVNSNIWAMPDIGWDNLADSYLYYDGPRHIIMLDTDGSLTGAYGNAITSNGSIVQDGGCQAVGAWYNYFNCSRSANGYSQITVTNQNTAGSNFGASLTWTYRAAFIPFGKPTVIDNVTGGDPRNQIRTEYSSNVISRSGYLLKFPHPTPPSLQLTLRFASTGEWLVLALQYPAGTTFTLNRGYSQTALTQVSTLSYLTKTTYYFDSTNEYLYVMYLEDNGSLVNSTGFPEYGYGASYVNIVASCGSACTVTAAHNVPSTYPDTEDKYQVTLKGCGSGTTSTHQGYAYFYFNKITHIVTYIIYHNISSATTAEILVNGIVYQVLPVGQAPIRGAFELSWNKWNALWNGTWRVVVQSSQYPNGEISGIPGCVGTCTTPPSISTMANSAPCTAINNQLVIYGDALNTSAGWSDWSWGSIRNYSYTADKRCGNDCLNALISSWGSVTLHAGNGNCNPGQCTQSWESPYVSLASYTYFQFNVRSPAGPIPTPLVISVQNSTGSAIGTPLVVNYTFIDNFVVEETWTRVKVPLTTLGCKSTDLVGIFSISMQATLANYSMLFDDIHLVPSYSDPLTFSAVGAVHNYAVTC